MLPANVDHLPRDLNEPRPVTLYGAGADRRERVDDQHEHAAPACRVEALFTWSTIFMIIFREPSR
jgi:hypothetical protein